MRFDLDGLEVFFPYERIYQEQYEYMKSLKKTLDAGGHCLLEMPTGTGKTVCLLSLITSYQYAKPSTGKLVYCTRTVPEMNSVMEELASVLAYRAEQIKTQKEEEIHRNSPTKAVNNDVGKNENRNTRRRKRIYRKNMGPATSRGGAGGSNILALCLSSRRNMCVNDRVMQESDREAVDSKCRSLTSSWVLERARKKPGSVETCSYYDNFSAAGESTALPSGIYDLDELKHWGKENQWCPYFLTRQAINHANILVFNYQYMLDPKVAKAVSQELESESIIVFDEAHNIDSVCIEALSVDIHERTLDKASRSLGILSNEISRIKSCDNARLQTEYQNLLTGLIDQGLLDQSGNDGSLSSNVLSSDILNQAVPGNIRRAEHFIAFMRKIVEYLKGRLRAVAGPSGMVHSETPLAFLHRMMNNTSLECKPLKFAYSRLSSLLKTLQVSNLDEFNSLSDVGKITSMISEEFKQSHISSHFYFFCFHTYHCTLCCFQQLIS